MNRDDILACNKHAEAIEASLTQIDAILALPPPQFAEPPIFKENT